MKSRIRVLTVLITLILFPVITTKQVAAQQSYVSFQVFYDQLSPYGQWIDHPNYGYVWIPDAGPDFAPYSSGGSWILTNYGWTWASDYKWGWAPFHYGRWDYDDFYGWFWIPDNQWGPTWVTWRRAEGYYGWEPMGPGITIGMSFGNDYNIYNRHWIFVNDKDFGRNNINRYYANQNDHERIFRNSTVINNTSLDNNRQIKYVSGPDRNDVRRVTGRNVNSYVFQEASVPGQRVQNGVYKTYRPEVRNGSGNQKQPAPARITNVQDIRQPSERNSSGQQNKSSSQRVKENALNRQNIINRQNETKNQFIIKQQEDANKQNILNRRNERNQQNAINQRELEKQQKAERQQELVKQQNTQKQQEVVKKQNSNKTKNVRTNNNNKKTEQVKPPTASREIKNE